MAKLPAQDIVERLRKAMEGVTPGPWGWVVHDHSMASLGVLPDPGLGDPLVLCVSPCDACQDRADPKEWKWGRCHTPSETDAAYIAICSPDNIGSLLDTISRLTADNEALRKEVERLEGLLEWTVPIHKDCSHVFIDGIGDVELDYGGKMRAEIRRLTEGRHAFACVVVNLSRQRDAATAHADTLAQEVERLRGEIETYRTAFDGIEPASRLLPLQETEK